VLPFLVIGVVRLVTRRSRADQLVLWWLLIYPIPAALTRGSPPDWLRAAGGIGVLDVIGAVGLVWAAGWVATRFSQRAAVLTGACLAALITLNATWFLSDYALRFPDRASTAFNDGIDEAVREIASREGEYQRVVLPADVPAVHDFYLFYARYRPSRLHAEGLEDAARSGAWADVRGFGRHRLCDPASCCGPGDLCLARGPWRGSGTVLREVRDRTGRTAFVIVRGD
jgi:hypothetical protein